MGNVFMLAYFFRNQCTHGKLSLFLIKTSKISNAAKAPKAIYYFDKNLVVPIKKSANEFTNLK